MDLGAATRADFRRRAIKVTDEHRAGVFSVDRHDAIVVETPDFHEGGVGNGEFGKFPARDVVDEPMPIA